MNITPQAPAIPIPTVANPATEALRRENHQREIITQPPATHQSAAEKGVASERERAKTPAQNNEQIDFENIRKQAEEANNTISEEADEGSKNPEQENQNHQSHEQESKQTDNKSEHDHGEQQVINDLKQRDREVRSHEQAHAATGGATTGAPKYTFEIGPDGKKYAVEGEVSVDLSPVEGNPRATIAKMQKVYAAALAPANPSIQDTRVANSAAQIIAQAQSELLAQQLEDPEQAKELNQNINPRGTFTGEQSIDENDFDEQIRQTLDAQERIAPSRSSEIDKRAVVIENFYSTINNAYQKPPTSQFELTA